jgi:elongator complex protein 2
VQALLQGHEGKVNAVKFLLPPWSSESMILSGSSDTSIRVWRFPADSLSKFDELAILQSHTSSINCLAVAPATNIFASGSADASVKIWKFGIVNGSIQFSLFQTIQTQPRFFPLALSLSEFTAYQDSLLAVAGTSGFVQIYLAEKDKVFCRQATLPGHEGWVRSLAIAKETEDTCCDFLLASASQDKYIRLWRIHRERELSCSSECQQTSPDISEKVLSNKAYLLKGANASYSLTFEALLLGHEDWIYTVSWNVRSGGLRLLSASADSSLAFWEPEANTGVWVCTTRLGEISAQKGSTTATGSTGGFWIGLWSPSGENVASLGRTGSWRVWTYDGNRDRWNQAVGVSGHTKAVTGISWAKDGSYLLSTSSDQTTRLHAEWKRGKECSWHELARPQIHGYDLNCIDSITQSQFISGADEKLLRVFDEPRGTADLLFSVCGIHPTDGKDMPDAANIPVLGLSNKRVDRAEDEKALGRASDVENEESTLLILPQLSNPDKPPLEDDLARHTLWPEREKLYGHGYEISAVASSHDGSIIATSCKASSIDHAVIRLFNTKTWREIKPPLMAHSLTVTCLRFSHDDKYLLSVGRDRQWATFERDTHDPDRYTLKDANRKGHSRMILSASWASLPSPRIFATAGRDKAVKLWKMQAEETENIATISETSAATAVDIYPYPAQDNIIIAVGTEAGNISIDILSIQTLDVQKSHSFATM